MSASNGGGASSPNWADKTIWTGDNLHVMRGMNSASVDLIYLDPPFNSNADYAAPIGSEAAGAEFKDTWTLRDVDIEWIDLMESRHPMLWQVLLAAMTPSDKSYLAYMAVRLLELHRLLKPTGCLWLHCDPTMSHYLKLLMDAIFGKRCFRNEIIWCYPPKGRGPAKAFHRKHDVLFFYNRSPRAREGTFHRPHAPLTDKQRKKFHAVDEQGRRYKPFKGKRTYLDASQGRPVPSWWDDIGATAQSRTEYLGYPTQKPLKLLQRIVAATSDSGDVVLDPFCGCATALVAADDLQRSWVGIDISKKAAHLVVQRIEERQGLYRDIIHREDMPQRTDMGKLLSYRSAAIRKQLYGSQEGQCAACDITFPYKVLEVDHIIARSKGGTDHPDNLQLLCPSCNRIKGNRGMTYLRERLQLAA